MTVGKPPVSLCIINGVTMPALPEGWVSDNKNVDDVTETGEKAPPRGEMSGRLDFVLTCLALALGVPNMWRFPVLMYKNGGAVFLIPYFVWLVIAGAPLFLLEVLLGQYMQRAGVATWRIAPLLQGIGVASGITLMVVNIYNIVPLIWASYYLVMGFNSVLPWSNCNNTWNTPNCSSDILEYNNYTSNESIRSIDWQVDPTQEFWRRHILDLSSGVESPGSLVWPLVLFLMAWWAICFLCVFYSPNLTAKLLYLLVPVPYLLLVGLLVGALIQPGSPDGLLHYLDVHFQRLADIKVWRDAGIQALLSLGVAKGATVALGSHNPVSKNSYREGILVCILACMTHVCIGLVLFPALGVLVESLGVPMEQLVKEGPELLFVSYTKALLYLPLPQLWSAIFFVTVIILALNSQFVGVQALLVPITDVFPVLRHWRCRTVLALVLCLISSLAGLLFVTKGGLYMFQLFDRMLSSSLPLAWVAIFECIAVSWVFGGWRFYEAIEMVVGHRVNPWLWLCWTAITPLVCLFLFLLELSTMTDIVYDSITFPPWANSLAKYGLTFIPLACICIGCGIRMFWAHGSFKKRWTKVVKPILRPDQIASHWPEAKALTMYDTGMDNLPTSHWAKAFHKVEESNNTPLHA